MLYQEKKKAFGNNRFASIDKNGLVFCLNSYWMMIAGFLAKVSRVIVEKDWLGQTSVLIRTLATHNRESSPLQ